MQPNFHLLGYLEYLYIHTRARAWYGTGLCITRSTWVGVDVTNLISCIREIKYFEFFTEFKLSDTIHNQLLCKFKFVNNFANYPINLGWLHINCQSFLSHFQIQKIFSKCFSSLGHWVNCSHDIFVSLVGACLINVAKSIFHVVTSLTFAISWQMDICY